MRVLSWNDHEHNHADEFIAKPAMIEAPGKIEAKRFKFATFLP